MKRSRLLVAVGLVAVGGCRAPPPAAGPSTLQAPGPPIPDDSLRWVSEAVARAARSGASSPVAIGSGAGSPGDSIGGRIRVPRDACGLVLVGGSPSLSDLDVFVYGDDGTVLAADETIGRSAAALVCPPHGEHLYAFGRVAAGHGLLSVSLQHVRPGDAEQAALAAGGRGALTQHALSEEAWPGLGEALARHRKGAGSPPGGAPGALGTWKETRRIAVPLDSRVPTHVTIPVDPGTCVDTLAIAADDVAFVELSVVDAEGRVVGRSVDGSETPSILICAATQTTVTVALRPRAGRGLAALVTSTVQASPSEFRGRRVLELETARTPPLAEARRDHALFLSGAGYGEGRSLAVVPTLVGERARLAVTLPGGCTRLDLVVGAPAWGLAASLWSEDGALLAEGSEPRRLALFPCTARMTARLGIDVEGLPGPVSVEQRTLPLRAPALTEEPLAASRLVALLARARPLSALAALSPRKVTLAPDALTVEEIGVPMGTCVTVALGSGPGLEGLEIAAATTPEGAALGMARGDVATELELCGDGSRGVHTGVRLELRSRGGTGTALLGVLSRAISPGLR